MIDQRTTTGRDVVPTADAGPSTDRMMDALQYGMAFLAIVVAILLAAVR